MKFRSPNGMLTVDGRLPKKEEKISQDRYYTEIENVFVMIYPYSSHLSVTFPCASEIALKFSYEALSKLAKTEPTLKEFVRAASNVEDISDEFNYGYKQFDDDFKWFVKLKP